MLFEKGSLHHTKDLSWSKSTGTRVRSNATTCSRAANLEVVCAVIHGADEGWSSLVRQSIAVAQEGHECGLCSHGRVRVFGVPVTGTWGAIRIVEDEFATSEEGV